MKKGIMMASLVMLVVLRVVQAQEVIFEDKFEDCSAWTAVRGMDDADAASAWDCGGTADYSVVTEMGNEDWFISQAIDVEGLEAASVRFFFFNEVDQATDHRALQVLFSEDFSGSYDAQGIQEANWTLLTEIDYNYEYAPFGALLPAAAASMDFSSEARAIHLAFLYEGGQGLNSEWQIDSVSLVADYYRSIDATAVCEDLLLELRSLISEQRVLPYTSDVAFDIWDAFRATDVEGVGESMDYTVWDMTTDRPGQSDIHEFDFEERDMGSGGGSEGGVYNRDHVFPRAWWGGGSGPNDEMFFDLWNLVPMDKYINGAKASHPLGEVNSGQITTTNGTRIGNSSSFGNTVFEPIDEYKGDFARMFLYMAARYGDRMPIWLDQNTLTEGILSGDSFRVYEEWLESTLLQWHEDDPVSDKERTRNETIFTLQGNRNPFVDHPEWVSTIWDLSPCVVSTQDIQGGKVALEVYPNPVSQWVEIALADETPIVDIQVYDMLGRWVDSPTQKRWSVSDYAAGRYTLVVLDQQGRQYSGHFGKIR